MKANRASPNVQIRVATAEDAEAIASALSRSFAEFKSAYTPEGFAATTPTADQLCARWNDGPVWIAVFNDSVVGTVSAVIQNGALDVRSMAVLPAERGLGIGHLLLKEAEVYALASNCKRLLLSTTPFLSEAIKLYERSGFRRSTEGPRELFGTSLFTMEKQLKTPG